MKHEVFVLGGQRIDQRARRDGREARGNEEKGGERTRKGHSVQQWHIFLHSVSHHDLLTMHSIFKLEKNQILMLELQLVIP